MKQSKKKKPCVVSVTIGDKTFEGEGETVYEALQAVKRPLKIMGKTYVTVTDGQRKLETMYMPVRARRMFAPLAQYVFAKQFDVLMK
jgi:hypothetical protein